MQIAEIDLKKYSNRFSSYTELRLHENRTEGLALLNGDMIGNSQSTSGGISARVHDKGTWGFSCNPELTNEGIERTIDMATRNAAFLASKCGDDETRLPGSPGNTASSDFTTRLPRRRTEEKVAFLKEVDAYVVANCPDVVSRYVSMNCLDMEKKLYTSEGSSGHNINTRAVVGIQLTARNEAGEPVELSESIADRGQFEDVFPSTEKCFEAVDKLYRLLQDKKQAVRPVAGYHDVILDPDLAGILAHEAIGHTTEGDIVRSGSVAGDFVGEVVASEMVTMVDFANSFDGETLPVPVYLDDEGVPGEDVVLIEKGVLKGFMHNKDSAAYFDSVLTGNARAFGYEDEPLIRMRNTAILPGSDRLEDMIASIENGYYLMKPTNGQADSTSEYMFGVQMGYEIKNGKLGRAIHDTTISGIAFDMLKEITMLSDEMVWICSGMCGKKQPMPVGMGGPAIKTKVFIGGE